MVCDLLEQKAANLNMRCYGTRAPQLSFVFAIWLNVFWSDNTGFENRCDCVSVGVEIKPEISLKSDNRKKNLYPLDNSAFSILFHNVCVCISGQPQASVLVSYHKLKTVSFLQIQWTCTWNSPENTFLTLSVLPVTTLAREIVILQISNVSSILLCACNHKSK